MKCIRCENDVEPIKENGTEICPVCKSIDSFEEDDGVSEDDYRQDNPREVPKE